MIITENCKGSTFTSLHSKETNGWSKFADCTKRDSALGQNPPPPLKKRKEEKCFGQTSNLLHFRENHTCPNYYFKIKKWLLQWNKKYKHWWENPRNTKSGGLSADTGHWSHFCGSLIYPIRNILYFQFISKLIITAAIIYSKSWKKLEPPPTN